MRGKKDVNFVNFRSKETCYNFVKKLYNFANQIDLDPLGKNINWVSIWKKKLTEIDYGKN